MALDVSLMSNIHNFYMTTYADKSNTPYDTHKKSELRSVYNSIVKMNRDTPLYILDTSEASRRFAVEVKENARHLKNTIASLGGMDEEEVLNKKTAYSSNEDLAEASFIGSREEGMDAPGFELEVHSLARSQVNRGNSLVGEATASLEPDTYSFDIGINDLNYEFQFNIRESDTNRDIQERLGRLINNSNIGLKAAVIEDPDRPGASYLRLESDATGRRNGEQTQFTVTDDRTSKRSGAIGYLGIDQVETGAEDAYFAINGEEHTASSNHFTVGQLYELTLNGVSRDSDDTAQIGLKTDVESLTENLTTLVRGYNDFMRAVSEYTSTNPQSRRLVGEMGAITRTFADGLTSTGVNLNLDGTLEVDEEKFKSVASDSESLQGSMSALRSFTQSVLRKADQVSLNPMTYVNKTIVAYKNPGHGFTNPYVTSAYSGMLFNSYC